MIGHIEFRSKKIFYANKEDFFATVKDEKWESETFDVLDKYIVSGKSFIDCGAWVGVLSIYAALLGAKVYSIEPDRIALNELVANIAANDLLYEIVYDNIALSNTNGVSELNSMNNGFGHSESSLIDRGDIYEKREVNTNTLGIFLDKYKIDDICLIKIDIEGSEMLLINDDTMKTLKRHGLPTIFISFHPAWILEKSIDDFISIFYAVYEVTSLKSGKMYSDTEFRKAMEASSDNSFLLTKK